MNRTTHPFDDDAFDPLAPVSGADETPPAGFDAATDSPADDALADLLSRATQPPTGLRIDHARLGLMLAAEPLPGRRRPQPGRIFRLVATSLAAAAAIVITTVVVLRGPGTPAQKPDTAALTAEPRPLRVARVGVDPTTAGELVANSAREGKAEVFYPRLPAGEAINDNAPAPSTSTPDASIVLIDYTPLTGTPYGGTPPPAGSTDAALSSFMGQ
ncbi:MAG: hypothetical protein BIFFINMI_01219 [Phycisphaerae bacterium]|nr:hypothetical protein [Phycisphaerae bacterium]